MKKHDSHIITANMATSLKSHELKVTTSSFQAKIKKKLEEKKSQTEEQQQKVNDSRIQILQIMNDIRSAYNQLTTIDLGEEYYLDFDINDLNGWPRLDLWLIHHSQTENACQKMIACVESYNQELRVEIRSSGGKVNCIIDPLQKANNDTGLLIKKNMRVFLDEVEAYILNTNQPNSRPLPTATDNEADSLKNNLLKNTDLFSEALRGNDNLVASKKHT